VLAYNTSHHTSLGVSPAEVLFGRKLISPGGSLELPSGEYTQLAYTEKLKYSLAKVQHLVMANIHKKRQLNEYRSAEINETQFEPGDKVMLFVPHFHPDLNKKLTPMWRGPFEIIRKGRNNKVYYISDSFGEELKVPVSISRLKPWFGREETETSQLSLKKDDTQSLSKLIDEEVNEKEQESFSDSEDGTFPSIEWIDPDQNYSPPLTNLRLTEKARASEKVLPTSVPESSKKLSTPKRKLIRHDPSKEIHYLDETPENKLLINHGAYRTEDGRIALEARLVPTFGKRKSRKRVLLDL